MDDSTKNKQQIKRVTASKYFWPIYFAIFITLFWAAWAPGLWSLFSSPGQIGDSYGGFTALVTGLSLVGIALNLYYQRKDTDTQVKMLSQQLDEAKASKDALTHQAHETERLSKITALQSKLTFFSQPNVPGSNLILGKISDEMYENDVATEIKRILSSLDQLTGHRGKRIIDVSMGKYHVCRVWGAGITYPKIKAKLLGITNASVIMRIELPADYKYELLRVTEIHPGKLFDQLLGSTKRKVGQKIELTEEDQLHFNISMDWGLLPHSKDYDITFTYAPHIKSQYIDTQLQ
jgi:hypothetical protein